MNFGADSLLLSNSVKNHGAAHDIHERCGGWHRFLTLIIRGDLDTAPLLLGRSWTRPTCFDRNFLKSLPIAPSFGINVYLETFLAKHCGLKLVGRNETLPVEVFSRLALLWTIAVETDVSLPVSQPEGRDLRFFLTLILTRLELKC